MFYANTQCTDNGTGIVMTIKGNSVDKASSHIQPEIALRAKVSTVTVGTPEVEAMLISNDNLKRPQKGKVSENPELVIQGKIPSVGVIQQGWRQV